MIIHLDVKSLNLLVGADLTLKLSDFGLAHMNRLSVDHEDNHDGGKILASTAGTPRYMAPEQLDNATAVDPRAFGGFQVAWLEFTAQDVDPFTDFSELAFVGFPQDRIGVKDLPILEFIVDFMNRTGRMPEERLRVYAPNFAKACDEAGVAI